MKISIRKLVFSAVIAAIYATVTLVLAPISYGPVQIRIAEIFCILPFCLPFSAWGLFVGCLIANLFSQYGLLDLVCGSLATLLAALLTMACGKWSQRRVSAKLLACLAPALCNGLVVGGMIAAVTTPQRFWYGLLLYGVQVAAGEAIVLFLLGFPLLLWLPNSRYYAALRTRLGLN